MKKYLLDMSAVAVVLAAAIFYYYGHSFLYRLMIEGPSGLLHIAGQ